MTKQAEEMIIGRNTQLIYRALYRGIKASECYYLLMGDYCTEAKDFVSNLKGYVDDEMIARLVIKHAEETK